MIGRVWVYVVSDSTRTHGFVRLATKTTCGVRKSCRDRREYRNGLGLQIYLVSGC